MTKEEFATKWGPNNSILRVDFLANLNSVIDTMLGNERDKTIAIEKEKEIMNESRDFDFSSIGY